MSKVNVQTHEDGAEILSAGPKEPLEPLGSCSYLLLAHGDRAWILGRPQHAPADFCADHRRSVETAQPAHWTCDPEASGSTHRASGPGRMLLTCHLHFPDLG